MNIEKLIKKISQEKLREFVGLYSSINPDFKTALEMHFSDMNEEIDQEKKYREWLKKIIKRHEHKGFIDYKSSFQLSNDFNDFLELGYALLEKKNFLDAFTLTKVALKETIKLITYCDDSAGCIGGLINDCVELLERVANDVDVGKPLKKQLFSYLQKELKEDIYFDYGDFGYRMFEIFESLAMATGQTELCLAHIDFELAKPDKAWSDYHKNFYVISKINFLAAIGQADEAEALIVVHQDVVPLRETMVNRAIEARDYTKAKSLVNEGIEIAQVKGHPGTVSSWQKDLLRIAELENDVRTVRYYNKHFAFDRGFDKLYYRAWKLTYSLDEWPIVLEQHIQELIGVVMTIHERNRQRGLIRHGQSMLSLQSTVASIYIEEQYLDRLLELVMKEESLGLILYYHDDLLKHYPVELLSVYLPAIRMAAEEAADRRQYQGLVKDMKRILKDIPDGKVKILELAEELKRAYYRRPAMVEELGKFLNDQ